MQWGDDCDVGSRDDQWFINPVFWHKTSTNSSKNVGEDGRMLPEGSCNLV
jgi:hypothetical protein